MITQGVKLVKIDERAIWQRIDNYLFKTLPNIPKSHIYKIIRSGQVRVNGKRIKSNFKLSIDDIVRVPPVKMVPKQSVVQNISKTDFDIMDRVLYEDGKLIVINKPGGIAVHGGSGINFGVVERVRAHLNNPEIHLAHRLDLGTSGCLILTKKRSMLRIVHECFRNKTVKKVYLAVVKGKWSYPVDIIEQNVIKNTLSSGERMVRVSDDHGKPASMRVELLTHSDDTSLIKIIPFTGLTHQIRVLTAYCGFPIVGDDKYGDKSFNREFFGKNKKNLLLHALSIGFSSGEQKYSFTAPVSQQTQKYYGNYPANV